MNNVERGLQLIEETRKRCLADLALVRVTYSGEELLDFERSESRLRVQIDGEFAKATERYTASVAEAESLKGRGWEESAQIELRYLDRHLDRTLHFVAELVAIFLGSWQKLHAA